MSGSQSGVYCFPLKIGWLSLTSGVSAPPTMVMPKAELVLGISTWDTSPSNTGSRVIPEMKRKLDETTNIQIDEANIQ